MTDSLHELKAELGRDVSDDELRLATEVLIRKESSPYKQVQAGKAWTQAGLSKGRAAQIITTWANDGLVSRADRDKYLLTVTTYGARIMAEMREVN